MAQPILSNNPLTPLVTQEVDPYFLMSPEEQSIAQGGTPIKDAVNKEAAGLKQIAANEPIVTPATTFEAEGQAAALKQKNNEQQDLQLRTQLEELVTTPFDRETKIKLANDIYSRATNPSSIRDSFIKVVSRNEVETVSKDAASVQQFLTDNNQKIADSFNRVQNLVEGSALESGAPLIDTSNKLASLPNSAVLDFGVQVLAPGTFAAPMINVIQQVMPDMNIGASDFIFPGEARQEFKRRIRAMDSEQQIDTLTRLSEAINSSRFVGTDNDFIQQELAHSLLNFRDGSTSEKVLDNIFGVVDFLFAGAVARDTIRTGVKLVSKAKPIRKIDPIISERVPADSNFAALSAAAPERAQKLAEQVILSPEESLAKILGASHESIAIETLMPKQLGADILPVPGLVDRMINKAYGIEKDLPISGRSAIANTLPTASRVDSAFAVAFDNSDEIEEVRQQLQGVALLGKPIGTQLINNTFFEEVGDVIRGVFHIGKTEAVGFNSFEQALSVAENYKLTLESHDFVNRGYKVSIYERDLNNNTFVPIKENAVQLGGEYRVVVELEEELLPTHALDINPIRTEKVSGFLTRWFDKSAWMKTWANIGTNAAFDQHSRVVKELRGILSPLNALKANDQRLIYQVLDYGDHGTGRWFSNDELKNAFGDHPQFEKLMNGYNAVREHQERLYDYMNAAARKQLLSRGFKELILDQDFTPANPLTSTGKTDTSFNRADPVLAGKGPILARRTDPSELNDILRTIRFTEEDGKSILANIYDADLDKVRPLNATDIKKLNEGFGVEVWETLRPIEHSGDGITDDISFILRSKRSKMKANLLPEQVIHRREGYITRMYDAAYVVRSEYIRRVNGGDIVPKNKVIGIENNLERAHALKKELVEQEVQRQKQKHLNSGSKSKFDEEIARKNANRQINIGRSDEVDISKNARYYDPTSIDWLQDTGHLYTSARRPKELTGARDPVTGKSRRMVLPINESIERSQFAAAQMNAIEPIISKLENNWVKEFGEMYQETTGGKFPWHAPLTVPKNMDPALQSRHDAAVALSEYVKNISGLNESAITRGTRNIIVRISEGLLTPKANHWRNRLAEGLLKHRNLNIIDEIKSVAFFQLITMRPLRQALLQANQMSLYMQRGDYGTYFLAGEGKKEFTAMWVGMLSKSIGNYDKSSETIARSFGYTKEQLDELVETYTRSGLPASIDSHMWVASSTLDRDLSRLASEVKAGAFGASKDNIMKGVNTTHKWVRRVGFDLGEQTQLLGAFLAEKRAWQLANPNKAAMWAKENNFRVIGGNARTLSGNMNRAGALHFQSGALGLAFQFMSHAAKMTSLIAPRKAFGKTIPGISKIASEHLTDREKYRMMMTQVLMYGTGGLGLSEGYEKLRDEFTEAFDTEVPQDVSLAVEEGLIGALLNMGIRIANGQDAFSLNSRTVDTIDLEFSKNLSPLGGTPFWTEASPGRVIMGYIFNTETRLADIMGPGAEVIGRMMGGIPTLYHVLGDASYLDTDEKIEASLATIATSGLLEVDNWSRMRYELAVGRYMSRTGNRGVGAHSAEIMSKTLLGVRSRTSRQVDNLNFAVTGVYGGYLKEPDSDFSDMVSRARSDFKNIRRVTELLGKGEVPLEDFESYVQNLAELNTLGMTERENSIYRSSLYKELVNWYDKDAKELEILINFEKVYKQASQDPVSDMVSRIRNMSEFEHREEFITQLEQLLL